MLGGGHPYPPRGREQRRRRVSARAIDLFTSGIRTTSYFHNQIGILTETIGNPTPIEIPFVPEMQLPRGDVPNPLPRLHFRHIEYSLTNNYAILGTWR